MHGFRKYGGEAYQVSVFENKMAGKVARKRNRYSLQERGTQMSVFETAIFELKVDAAKTLGEWKERVRTRHAHVGIIGLGYVGLPLALLFAAENFRVTGFDADSAKVEKLNRGESYIWRIEREHIERAKAKGFKATDDFAEIARMDAVLICVPTPLSEHHVPDLSYVVATVETIAQHVHAGQLVVLESTTYPGTTEEIVVRTLNGLGAERGVQVMLRDVDAIQKTKTVTCGVAEISETPDAEFALDGVMVAFSPEREDPGNLVILRNKIPRVIGGVDGSAEVAAEALYGAIFEKTVTVSTPAAAEMTKLLENIYRAVNIAMVNELKQLCLRMGIDVWEVINAAATKPFGFQAFYPGPGIGGHCIPVDPFYLSWKAREYGFTTKFIELAGEINEAMPTFIVQQVALALNDARKALNGAQVLVLGVGYKRDVDDLRESPSLTIIELLRQRGVRVSYNDPFFPTVGRGRKYVLDMRSTPLEGLEQYDCVLIATDHSSYDYERIVRESRLVIDTRNATRDIPSAKVVRC